MDSGAVYGDGMTGGPFGGWEVDVLIKRSILDILKRVGETLKRCTRVGTCIWGHPSTMETCLVPLSGVRLGVSPASKVLSHCLPALGLGKFPHL